MHSSDRRQSGTAKHRHRRGTQGACSHTLRSTIACSLASGRSSNILFRWSSSASSCSMTPCRHKSIALEHTARPYVRKQTLHTQTFVIPLTGTHTRTRTTAKTRRSGRQLSASAHNSRMQRLGAFPKSDRGEQCAVPKCGGSTSRVWDMQTYVVENC